MLAQSFKSASKLRLTDLQFDALVKTLAYLEQEKIEWKSPDSYSLLFGTRPNARYFNLRVWKQEADCGTVMCIGGTAEWLSGNEVFEKWEYYLPSAGKNIGVYERTYNSPWTNIPALNALFNPQYVKHQKVTVLQAARALRNFLTTGHANWRKVLKEVH